MKKREDSWKKEWNETTSKIKKSGRNLNVKIGYDTSDRNRSGYKDPTAKAAIDRCR